MGAQNQRRRRPLGVSSRVREVAGKAKIWTASNGQQVRLPLIVDHMNIDEKSGNQTWLVEAKVDLVEMAPELISVHVEATSGLDAVVLQRFFRWVTPLEVVRFAIPTLLEKGINPLCYDFPTEGFPDAAHIGAPVNKRLSDEFLLQLAQEYVDIGRGYAKTIAQRRGVSPRTVVSWVEKARKRGFIEPTKPGRRSTRLSLSAQHLLKAGV